LDDSFFKFIYYINRTHSTEKKKRKIDRREQFLDVFNYCRNIYALTAIVGINSVSQKSSPLKHYAIFSLRLSIFPWNFANLLPVCIYTRLPVLVNLL